MEGMDFAILHCEVYSLNPYYNGRYSWRMETDIRLLLRRVLILIIMEDTHGVTWV